jgi:hypothetical protein
MLEAPVLSPEATALMWKLGRLKAKLQPSQKRVHDAICGASPEEIFCVICSRGFGKTFTSCAVAIETAMQQKEPANILIISSTLKKLRTIVKPAFLTILQDCPEDLKPTYNGQDSYWQFPNGVRVHLVAGEHGRIEDIRGIHRVILVLIDEAAFFGDEEDSYPLDYIIQHILTPMFIRTKSKARIIATTTPPETPNHPIKAIFQQSALSGATAVFDIYQSDIALEKVDEMHRRMLKAPGGQLAWEREMLCKWVVDTNRLIIPEWNDRFIRVTPRDDLFPLWDKYFTLDIGSVDKTVGLLFYYDFRRGKLVFEDEIVYEGRQWTTDNLASELRAKEIGHWGPNGKVYRRVADSDNQILLADLTHLHRLPIMPTTKNSLNAMVNQARMMVKSERVEVNPRCKLLIQTLRDGIWNKSKDEFGRTTILGHMDAIAAFIYGIRNVDEAHNPVPVTYGYQPENQIYPTQPKSKSTQAMETALLASNPFMGGSGEL